MTLQGSLSTLELSDLLDLMARGQRSCHLVFHVGPATKRVLFNNGVIVGADSTDPIEYLGQYLLAEGLVSEEQIRQALERRKRTGDLLGEELVELGAIRQETLERALSEKARAIVLSLFELADAQFEYSPDPLPTPAHAEILVPELIEDGLNRREVIAALRARLPNRQVVLAKISLSASGHLNLFQRLLFDQVDGRRDIAQLQLLTHSTEFMILQGVAHLIDSGAVGIIDSPLRKASGESGLTQTVELGEELLERGDYDQALQVLEGVLRTNADRRRVRILAQHAELLLLKETYERVPWETVPRLLIPSEKVLERDISPEAFFLLSRIEDGHNVRALVQISPLREVDVLRHLIALERGRIISLEAVREGEDMGETGARLAAAANALH